MDNRRRIAVTGVGAVISAPFAYLATKIFEAWGVLDALALKWGTFLKKNVTPDQAGWTFGFLVYFAFMLLFLWVVWHKKKLPPVPYAPPIPIIPPPPPALSGPKVFMEIGKTGLVGKLSMDNVKTGSERFIVNDGAVGEMDLNNITQTSKGSGPTVQQNHSGSGHNINAKTVNLGGQKFEMDDGLKSAIVASFRELKIENVDVQTAMDSASMSMGKELARHLRAEGFTVGNVSLVMRFLCPSGAYTRFINGVPTIILNSQIELGETETENGA